ncbi:MAG: universal stress protein [Balneolales bacterium]
MKNVNILVPIDFSELSLKALEPASMFAEMFDGAVTPFHSYISLDEMGDMVNTTSSSTKSDANKTIEEKLVQQLNEVVSRQVNHQYLNSGIIYMGNPSEAIVDVAHDFDMIVMTTHGRTGFSRLLLGSVTEKVIRFAPVPVLVIEEHSRLKPLKKILFTTDFSDHSLKAVPFVRTISEAAGADLDIVHIVSFEQFGSIPQIQSSIDTKKKLMRKLVENRFDDLHNKVTSEILTTKKSIHEKITRLAQKQDYNLIVMATIGRTGLEYLRLGSTASNVVRHVENAVLTINPHCFKKTGEWGETT